MQDIKGLTLYYFVSTIISLVIGILVYWLATDDDSTKGD